MGAPRAPPTLPRRSPSRLPSALIVEELAVIPLTRLNGQSFFLNLDFIESIEACPDTLITLTNGKHLLVQETPEDISDRVVSLRRYMYGTGPRPVFLKPMMGDAKTTSE